MKGKKGVIIAVVILLLVIAGLSQVNMGGDLVVSQAARIVSERMGLDLSVQEVRGNPLRGYHLQGISIASEEEPVLSLESASFKLKLLSLLSGSPFVSGAELMGSKVDYERIRPIIANLDTSGGGEAPPLGGLRLRKIDFSYPGGEALIRDSLLRLDGENIGVDLDLVVNEVPVTGKFEVRSLENLVELKKLALKVGEGDVRLSGGVLPDLSVRGEISDVEIGEVVKFWPIPGRGEFDGKLSTTVNAGGTWKSPVLSGSANYKGSRVAGYPLQMLEGDWRYGAEELSSDNLNVRLAGVPVSGEVSFVFGRKAPVIHIDLRGTEIDMSALRDIYSGIPADLGGKIDSATVRLDGPVTGLSGAIKGSAGEISLRGQKLTESWISLVIENGKRVVASGKSKLNGQPLYLQGNVLMEKGAPRLDLLLKVRKLDLDLARRIAGEKVLPKDVTGQLDMDLGIAGTVAKPVLRGKIWSDGIGAMGQSFASPALSFNYDGRDLKLTSLNARWNDAPISASGTVKNVMGEKKPVNLNVRIDGLNTDTIAALYPPMTEYGLRGKITGKALITGELPSPLVDLALFSSNLAVKDIVRLTKLRVATKVVAAGKAPEKLDLRLTAAAASTSAGRLKDLSLRVIKAGQEVRISEGDGKLGGGSLSAEGNIMLSGEKTEAARVDVKASLSEGDVAEIVKGAGLNYPLAGKVSAGLSLGGVLDDPDIALDLKSPRIAAYGLAFDGCTASLEGRMKKLILREFGASVGGSPLKGSGSIDLSGKAPDVSFEVVGSGMDIAAATKDLAGTKDLRLTGKVDLDFKARFRDGRGSGKGNLSSPALGLYGLKFDKTSSELLLEGSKLRLPRIEALFYGGRIDGNAAIDMASRTHSEKVDLTKVSLSPLLKDFLGIKGSISGIARAKFSASGKTAPTFSIQGQGVADLDDGQISGFKVSDIAASLYGMSAIRYRSVHLPFGLDNGRIKLEDGTVANAHEGDPLYHFLKARGTIGPESRLVLACNGEVNVMMLNVLVGAGVGGITSIGSVEDVLKGIITGGRKGAESEDFRDVSLKIGGTFDKPSFSEIRMGAGRQKAQPQETVTSPDPGDVGELVPDIAPEKMEIVSGDEEEPEEILKKELEKQIFKKILGD